MNIFSGIEDKKIIINNFTETKFPMILSFPHSGRDYKKDLISNVIVEENELRQSEDMYLDKIFPLCKRIGINSIFANFPRIYVDVNRDRFEINKDYLSDCPNNINFQNSNLSNSGIGVIHTKSSKGALLYDKKINWSEFINRLNKCYDPWYKSLYEMSFNMRKKFLEILILDCHSYPSNLIKKRNESSCEFVIGDNNGLSCNSSLVNFLVNYISNAGFKVNYNFPFSGQNILKTFGRPKNGINAIQIEIRKDLYLDEVNFSLKNVNELENFLKNLMYSLSEFIIFEEENLNVAE